MSKWKHPYVIKVSPGPSPRFELLALCYRNRHEPHYYRLVDAYPTIKKALKVKRKAYERLQK